MFIKLLHKIFVVIRWGGEEREFQSHKKFICLYEF